MKYSLLVLVIALAGSSYAEELPATAEALTEPTSSICGGKPCDGYCFNDECIKLKPAPTTAKPEPKPTCETVICKPGTRCYAGECYPLKPVPTTERSKPTSKSCENVTCEAGSRCYAGECYPLKPVPTTPGPTPKLSCDVLVCGPGYKCYDGDCVELKKVTCASLHCIDGYECLENPARCVKKEK